YPPTAPPTAHAPPLHDALPISCVEGGRDDALRTFARIGAMIRHAAAAHEEAAGRQLNLRVETPAFFSRFGIERDDGIGLGAIMEDRKSTRLNSSHVKISYAVFC